MCPVVSGIGIGCTGLYPGYGCKKTVVVIIVVYYVASSSCSAWTGWRLISQHQYRWRHETRRNILAGTWKYSNVD